MNIAVTRFHRIVCLLLVLCFSTAEVCRGDGIIAAGDRVRVDFSVRLADGSLLITTRPDSSGAAGQVKAPVYMILEQSGAVALTAGPALNAPRLPIDKGFEGELLDQLGRAVVGLKVGETRSVTLKSATLPDLPDGERFLRLSRVRLRDRRTKMQKSQYLEVYKQAPVKGARIPFEPPVEAMVRAVDDEVVEVELISPDGAAITTDFGPGTVKDKGARGYEIVLAAKPGTLIRTNHLLGRIVAADERRFTIDYGDLFGGETLHCELTVVGVER